MSATAFSDMLGLSGRTMSLAIKVAAERMISEPGTKAVSTPAAPITPTNQGSKVWIESLNSDRSMPAAGEAGNLQDRGEAAEEHEQRDELIERQRHRVAPKGALVLGREHRSEGMRPHVEAERRQRHR